MLFCIMIDSLKANMIIFELKTDNVQFNLTERAKGKNRKMAKNLPE